jgi:hypothetical protein
MLLMKIKTYKNMRMVSIHMCDEDDYELTDDNGVDVDLSDDQQRKLIVWFWKNRSALVRAIVCEKCPEHTGVVK